MAIQDAHVAGQHFRSGRIKPLAQYSGCVDLAGLKQKDISFSLPIPSHTLADNRVVPDLHRTLVTVHQTDNHAAYSGPSALIAVACT